MSLLKIPQGWKPKNQPADPRGHYDPRIYLPRMAAKLRQTPEPTAEEDEAFNELERLHRAALYQAHDEPEATVPKAQYDRLVYLMRRAIHSPEHAHEISELILED